MKLRMNGRHLTYCFVGIIFMVLGSISEITDFTTIALVLLIVFMIESVVWEKPNAHNEHS